MVAGILSFVGVVVVAVILWIVFMPVLIAVDSTARQLEISQRGTFAMHWAFEGPPQVRVFGFKTSIAPSGERPKKSRARKSRTFDKSVSSWIFLIRGCLKSISVRNVVVDVDTGDVALNARLVPAMFFMSSDRVSLTTNFRGRIHMHVEAEARLNKLLWTWILFLTKK